MTMMMPAMHVGRGTRMGPLSVFPVWTDARGTGRTGHGARRPRGRSRACGRPNRQ